ncbi:MAG TPA: DNA-binding response regulator, partial [Thalassospira sp.]|nr:DNA-binding response regulator [Thalassospira sp.]
DGEDTASDGVPLTSRERTVLRLLAKGASNKHVARELDISVRTVETHRRNIKRKLDIDSSAGLVRYAIEKGLVTLDSTS